MKIFDNTFSLTNDQRLALEIIKDYSEEFIFDPKSNWPDYYFKRTSYQKWAVEELIKRIKDKKYERPIDIIDEFEKELFVYMEEATSLDSFLIFDVATETIDLIGSLFM